MAVEGEEMEYESDPEDAIVPSAMRRREASDDEEGSDADGGKNRPARNVALVSGPESDDQGGAPTYDDDDDEEFDEELEEEIEEEIEGKIEEEEGVVEKTPHLENLRVELEEGEEGKEEEVEKKENEPFAVPTAGAFYMHDDRFAENGRGRHRRMLGGRRLWESKDDRAWVHDRFEEMNLQDNRYDEGRRNTRGRFRGRGGGKIRGGGHGYIRGARPRAYHDDGNIQIRVQKSVRGRGPRRYEPPPQNTEVSRSQYNQFRKAQDLTSNTSTERRSSQTSNVQPDPVLPRKQVFASSLSSASPPFYPSGSSNQDVSRTQKRDAQSGANSRSLPSSMHMENNFPVSQSASLVRGKAVVDSHGHDRLYMNDSSHPVGGKTMASAHLQSVVPSVSSVNTTQSANPRAPGRGLNINGTPNYQTSVGQMGKNYAQMPPPAVQQRPLQTNLQSSLRISTQQSGQRVISGSQVSSPPHGPSTNSSEVGEMDSPPSSSKSKTSLVGQGKTSNQGAGRGFLYGGAQVAGATGAMSLNPNDQNFSGTPTILPVMQFGGQHHGGLGVPAVGMAFPGYMAQPQLGFGNSEMTWFPVITGPAGALGAAGALGTAGALGASYCPPYIALDSNYHPRPSGQTSSSVTSNRETSAAKPANSLKPPQRPEPVNDEFGQRQNKPRRYSEMNFGQ